MKKILTLMAASQYDSMRKLRHGRHNSSSGSSRYHGSRYYSSRKHGS